MLVDGLAHETAHDLGVGKRHVDAGGLRAHQSTDVLEVVGGDLDAVQRSAVLAGLAGVDEHDSVHDFLQGSDSVRVAIDGATGLAGLGGHLHLAAVAISGLGLADFLTGAGAHEEREVLHPVAPLAVIEHAALGVVLELSEVDVVLDGQLDRLGVLEAVERHVGVDGSGDQFAGVLVGLDGSGELVDEQPLDGRQHGHIRAEELIELVVLPHLVVLIDGLFERGGLGFRHVLLLIADSGVDFVAELDAPAEALLDGDAGYGF